MRNHVSIKSVIIYILVCTKCLCAAGEIYTITSSSGQELQIINPNYDGASLKATRLEDRRSFNIDPQKLSPESWKALNKAVTAKMRISLNLTPHKISRRDTVIQSAFENYDQSQVSREFKVSATSTSYFKKPMTIVCYWISGRDISIESHKIELSRTEDFEIISGGSASQTTIQGYTFPTNYREKKETDFVVVAEHEDGSIAEIKATQKGAEELIIEYYTNK